MNQHNHLLRVLGLVFGLAAVVGGVVGQGILRAPGVVAQADGSAAVLLGLWVLGGLLSLVLALPFAGAVEREGAVGLIDERHALDGNVELGIALAFWRGLDGGDAPLERLGLADLLDVPVRYLSTGQKKRAALARLIAQGAPIWLLDEPLNGLDTGGVALVEGLIAEHLASDGLAVIASHQPLSANAATLPLAEFIP